MGTGSSQLSVSSQYPVPDFTYTRIRERGDGGAHDGGRRPRALPDGRFQERLLDGVAGEVIVAGDGESESEQCRRALARERLAGLRLAAWTGGGLPQPRKQGIRRRPRARKPLKTGVLAIWGFTERPRFP
jgi:hypothetical protein